MAGIDDTKLKIIPLGQPDTLLRAYESLEQGGVVAMLADRVNNGAHLKSNFLGHAAPFPIGPHVLAARAGASVLMCFGLYEGGNRYRIDLLDFGPAAPAGSRGPALQPQIDHYAALLEKYAVQHPHNWFNFFPFWSQE